MRTPTLAVWIQLRLGWNTCLLLNSVIVNILWKTDDGEAENIVLLMFVLWRNFNRWLVLFRASWNCIFFQPGFCRGNKHDTFWHVLSTRYFYVLFLWVIAVSDFSPLEVYKNFPCQSTATQITILINIFTSFRYYTVWNQFFY